MKKLTISDLNRLHTDGDSVDQEVYAEQRSNVLLVAGEHYSKRTKQYFDRVRESEMGKTEQRIRITANHIQKVIKLYCNNVLSYVPGVQCYPSNETEIQDQKAASLNNEVWTYGKTQFGWESYRRNAVWDFFTLGEVGTRVFFDPNKGKYLGKVPKSDFVQQVDGDGVPIPPEDKDLIAKFSGKLDVERLYSFNLFRAKEAKTWEESWFIGIKKLVDKEKLKASVAGDPEKEKLISEGSFERFIIFDGATSAYRESDRDCLVLEYYIKPSPDYPMGYFFITTKAGILAEGELPFGEFPIVIDTCEEYQTSPRGRSPIKHGRPFQAELNRTISKMAEHQITLGDDKLVMANGSKISQGAILPGVRGIYTTGAAPVVLEGRTGEQYLGYAQFIIQQLYSAMLVEEDQVEKDAGQADPYTMLFRSVSQKKKFSFFSQKIEKHFSKVCEVYLSLARQYMDDEELLQAVGKDEQVNLAEFRSADRLCYHVKTEPVSEDAETALGRQLVYNHILQYVGPQLGRADIGKILQSMPMGNFKDTFSDFTLDDENAVNDILKIERGDVPSIRPGQDPSYTLKRITSRQKKPDYDFLSPPVKEVYETYSQALAEELAAQLAKQKSMEADSVPAQGFLTPCDFYVPDPANPAKTRRARLPIDALAWLVKRLEEQGVTLERLESLQGSAQARVGEAASAMAGANAESGLSQTVGQSNPGEMNDRSGISRTASNISTAVRGVPSPQPPVPGSPGSRGTLPGGTRI